MMDKFNPQIKQIKPERRIIDVTRESVHEMLGLPLGHRKLENMPFRNVQDTCYVKWTEQFTNKSMIHIQETRLRLLYQKLLT